MTILFRYRTLIFLSLLGMLLSCNETRESTKEVLSVNDLLLEYNDSRRLISSETLADLIINKDPSLRLIDVRDPGQYEDFSLPESYNVPLDQILNEEFTDILDCSRYKIVCYSNSDILSDKAWMIKRELGCKDIYVLKGGLNAWVENIFQPTEPGELVPSEEVESYKMRLAMRNYFLGLSQELDEEPFFRPRPRKSIVVTPKKPKEDEEEEGC